MACSTTGSRVSLLKGTTASAAVPPPDRDDWEPTSVYPQPVSRQRDDGQQQRQAGSAPNLLETFAHHAPHYSTARRAAACPVPVMAGLG